MLVKDVKLYYSLCYPSIEDLTGFIKKNKVDLIGSILSRKAELIIYSLSNLLIIASVVSGLSLFF